MENQNKIVKKILVVEDDVSLLNALVNRLSNLGYTVVQAKNGKEGLEAAFKHHPNLILLDVIMPEMDGLTMLDELRQDSWGSKVKVIILTNQEMDDKRLDVVVKDQPSFYLVKSDNSLEQIQGTIEEIFSADE